MITIQDYQQAERDLTVREWRRGWMIHAIVYGVVNVGLIVLNLLLIANTAADFVWFPFPLVGWGIGLTMHYVHGVRWADREIAARQAQIEQHVSTTGQHV